MSTRLTKEVNEIRQRSFPELMQVQVFGRYLPSYKFLANRTIGHVDPNPKGTESNPIISLADFLSLPRYFSERRGVIAHELSHLILGPNHSEREVDYEAIKRGYGRNIAKIARTLREIHLTTVCSEQETYKIMRELGYKLPSEVNI